MQQERRRKRRRRRRSPILAIALLALILVGIILSIAAVVWGISQLFQPGSSQLPTIIGTQPQAVDTVQSEEESEGDTSDSTAEYTIVIDPGHGGGDGGTEGYIVEKEMTHAVSALLYNLLLEDARFTPILTHSLTMADDEYISQGERVEVAQSVSPDLFLSIHGNAYEGEGVRGTECFPIPPERDYHEESLAFAQLVAAGFGEMGAVLRGETGVRYAYFRGVTLYYGEESDTEFNTAYTYEVLQGVDYPAVLVEQCYISSAEDMELFGGEEGYEMAAQVYYTAICDYFY